MKKITQLATAIALASCALASTSAFGDVSYNIGWASEYYYRGLLQKSSSASGGIDFEEGGFYAGAWGADVGDGLEVDGYFGYGIETEEGFSASIGFTGYYYTGEFDDTYEEFNLGLGFGMFSLEYSAGEWSGFGTSADYDFFAVTIENEGFYGTYGTFGDEFDGDYFEIGYGTTISDIDFGIAAIFSSDELSDQSSASGFPEESQALIFTIGMSF